MRTVKTLGQFIIERQEDFPYAKGELSRLLRDIGIASKIVNREVNKAGLVDILGEHGTTNIQGETVKKLDVYANDQFISALSAGGETCGIASEENDDLVPMLSIGTEGGGRCGTCQTRAHHYDVVLAAVGGVHQLHVEAAFVPILLDWSWRYPGLKHVRLHCQRTKPVITATGTDTKPANTTMATTRERILSALLFLAVLQPSVCIMLQIPWSRWRHSAPIATM